jgi:hypothetical protein
MKMLVPVMGNGVGEINAGAVEKSGEEALDRYHI